MELKLYMKSFSIMFLILVNSLSEINSVFNFSNSPLTSSSKIFGATSELAIAKTNDNPGSSEGNGNEPAYIAD